MQGIHRGGAGVLFIRDRVVHIWAVLASRQGGGLGGEGWRGEWKGF